MINALQNLRTHYNTRTKSTSTVGKYLESWKLLKKYNYSKTYDVY